VAVSASASDNADPAAVQPASTRTPASSARTSARRADTGLVNRLYTGYCGHDTALAAQRSDAPLTHEHELIARDSPDESGIRMMSRNSRRNAFTSFGDVLGGRDEVLSATNLLRGGEQQLDTD